MNQQSDLEQLRDEALRKIGRNLVNLQKIEAMLKFLVPNMRFQARIEDLPSAHAKQMRAVERHPMGRLADAFCERAYSASGAVSDIEETFSVPGFSFSFRIESDADLLRERRLAIADIVAERNRLVHRMLGPFDPNSARKCTEIIEALDEQHSKVLPEYQELAAIVRAFLDYQSELKNYIDSQQFIDDLGNARRSG